MLNAYPFLASSDLTCQIEIQKYMLSGSTLPPDSKDTKLANSDQEASPSVGKNTAIVLVPGHP